MTATKDASGGASTSPPPSPAGGPSSAARLSGLDTDLKILAREWHAMETRGPERPDAADNAIRAMDRMIGTISSLYREAMDHKAAARRRER